MSTATLESVADRVLAEERRALRRLAKDDGSNTPIRIVPGNAAPHFCGTSAHYTTPKGKPIYHPNSYVYHMVRHASTVRVEVGEDWLDAWRARQSFYASAFRCVSSTRRRRASRFFPESFAETRKGNDNV
jgi:hypothetical protein